MIPSQELFPGEKPQDFIYSSTMNTNNPTVCTVQDIYGAEKPVYNQNLTNGFCGGFDEQLTGHDHKFTEHV